MNQPPGKQVRGDFRRGVSTPTRQSNRQSSQGPMVPVSFAKQSKSREERLYSRFSELNPDAVRVTRYPNGTVEEEVKIFSVDKVQWITAVAAEELLRKKQASKALERNIMRAPVRLGRVLNFESYQKLSDEDRAILEMTQTAYNSFRAYQKAQGWVETRPIGETRKAVPKAGADDSASA